jgi:ribonuclease D
MQYQYITSNSALDACVQQMEGLDSIAIDLEFDKNRFAYGFNLCLLQIYTGKQCFLIDPLVEKLNIQKIFPSLENPDIQKVVFAFGEDLRLLHSLGCFPKNLFDIAVAAKLLNHPPGSLAALLDEVLQIEVSKSSQKSNWLKRPLTRQQLDYAALDVVYLLKLKTAIVEEALGKNKLDWINEENAAFDELSYAGIENNNFIKKKEQNGLSEFEWYVYRELMHFREKIAEKTGRPSYQVYDKELIKELALKPEKIEDWGNKMGNYKAFKFNGFKNQLKRILEKAKSLGLSKTEPAKKPLSKEESLLLRRQRSMEEVQKKKFFKPIQKEIIQEHGEHAATLILGNRVIATILAGETEKLKPYQVKIIKENAKKLDIDISSFFA